MTEQTKNPVQQVDEVWSEVVALAASRGWSTDVLAVALAQGLGQLVQVCSPTAEARDGTLNEVLAVTAAYARAPLSLPRLQ